MNKKFAVTFEVHGTVTTYVNAPDLDSAHDLAINIDIPWGTCSFSDADIVFIEEVEQK